MDPVMQQRKQIEMLTTVDLIYNVDWSRVALRGSVSPRSNKLSQTWKCWRTRRNMLKH